MAIWQSSIKKVRFPSAAKLAVFEFGAVWIGFKLVVRVGRMSVLNIFSLTSVACNPKWRQKVRVLWTFIVFEVQLCVKWLGKINRTHCCLHAFHSRSIRTSHAKPCCDVTSANIVDGVCNSISLLAWKFADKTLIAQIKLCREREASERLKFAASREEMREWSRSDERRNPVAVFSTRKTLLMEKFGIETLSRSHKQLQIGKMSQQHNKAQTFHPTKFATKKIHLIWLISVEKRWKWWLEMLCQMS